MEDSGNWWNYIVQQMGMDLRQIPIVIVSAILIYFAFMLSLRVFGARVLSVTTATDAVVVVMLGSVSGRAILGLSPTVTSGLVALATLIALELALHGVRDIKGVRQLVGTDPVVVFANGKPLKGACERTHTSKADLHSAMRKAGIASAEDIQLIILEPNGTYSVIPAGVQVADELLLDVEGGDALLSEKKRGRNPDDDLHSSARKQDH